MPATVTPQLANPDPNAVPTNLQQLHDELNNSFLTVNVSGGPFTPYVISSTTPIVADQDKIWFKVDGNGRPLGIYKFYSGNWRKIYTGNPTEIKIFTGDPATYFDGTGLGIVGGEWDGWALCNGNNATPNLSNKFVTGGAMDNVGITGYSSGWKTSVAGGSLGTGGAATQQIINANLPLSNTQITGFGTYDGGASHTDKYAIITGKYDAGSTQTTLTIGTIGADPQTALSTVPPFYALAFVMFKGYA